MKIPIEIISRGGSPQNAKNIPNWDIIINSLFCFDPYINASIRIKKYMLEAKHSSLHLSQDQQGVITQVQRKGNLCICPTLY